MQRTFPVSKQVLTLIGVGLLALALVVSTSVFAAIPHTATKMISACRDNTTGDLRVIDVQDSETCSGSETALQWSGHQTATVNIAVDPEDETLSENYDASVSRNVISATRITTSPTDNGYCINLPFTPLYGTVGSLYGVNNSGDVDSLCGGSGYEAFVPLGVRSWFFTE
jgi:hypothetical protein